MKLSGGFIRQSKAPELLAGSYKLANFELQNVELMGISIMKKLTRTGAVLLSSLLATSAMSAQMSPEEQAAADISTRQAVFKLLSFSMGPLGGMARGAEYDEATAMEALDRVGMLAQIIPAAFNSDTTAYDHPNRANDSIWSSKADFDQKAADLAAGAEEAKGILAAQGAAGVRAAVGAVGPKCGACHDIYRHD
jgi:cytochrome c556